MKLIYIIHELFAAFFKNYMKVFHFSPRKNTGPKIAWGETYERDTYVQFNYS